jgi:hypothetical protein
MAGSLGHDASYPQAACVTESKEVATYYQMRPQASYHLSADFCAGSLF